ncbi:MAG TPA: YCF48-related protein [Bacteroidota bacterium]|nr:YCF48-related protein [Bacteroidota bacterium]
MSKSYPALMNCLAFVAILAAQLSSATETWNILLPNPSSNYAAVRFVDHERGWAVGSGGTISRTTDAGATWIPQTSGTTADLKHLWFVNASIGWVVGQNGTILKTTDGGASWLPQTSATAAHLNCVYFKDAQNGWAAGANGAFLKTTNGGDTWNLQQPPTTANITAGWNPSASTIFMTCEDGTMMRSTDSGTTWQIQFPNFPNPMYAVHFVSPNLGWAVGADGRIKKTEDGGHVWYIQDAGTTDTLYAVFFVNADTGWVAGANGLVKCTTNGGLTWETQNAFTTETLRGLWFLNGRHGYAVGTNGTVREYGFNPLPVQLASFTATVINGNSVQLEWRTISEINNYGFEVQRALSQPTNFITLPGSFIPGHGTTNEPQTYSYLDPNVPYGRLYYRLKQIDLDGTIHHSQAISLDVLTDVTEAATPESYVLKQNYPNPFNPSTTIEFSLPKDEHVALRIYNALGEVVATLVNEQLRAGTHKRVFSASGLASGVYFYKLSTTGSVLTQKMLLLQ